ncbi:MAG: hypothetical protein JNL74_00420 [Fibrobacteres bacterium]|nr:hypothetical protein [Fibrobacterota bacterium]
MSNLKYKFNKVKSAPSIYLNWIFVTVLATLAVLANVVQIWTAHTNSAIIVLSLILLLLSFTNMFLTKESEAYKIRHRRLLRINSDLHDVAEKLRDYRTTNKSESDCLNALTSICFTTYAKIMSDMFGRYPKITIKYISNGKLCSLRSKEQTERCGEPEMPDSNPIFKLFVKYTDKFKELYIKNTDDIESNKLIFGLEATDIKARALKHDYRTFLAIPIRQSGLITDGVCIKNTIGFIGADLPSEDLFGDILKDEMYIFYTIADLVSEVIVDLQKTKTQ